MQLDQAVYQRVLGDEIRRLRKRRGWTRKDLNDRLQSEISLQTLATYELGTRQLSVVRFVEICVALDELPHELMARVHARVFIETPGNSVQLDLSHLAAEDDPALWPVRRWAADKLRADPRVTTVTVDRAALAFLATLCGVERGDLLGRLRAVDVPA